MSHTPKHKVTPQAAQPAVAMLEMMQNIDALRDVYVRETEALSKANTQAFFGMQEEKMQAARAYQGSIEQLLAHKDALKAADPQLKMRLDQMYKDFVSLSEKNMNALQRMNRCVEHIGTTMRNAAREAAEKQRTFSYGQGGLLQRPENKTVSMGISETA